MKKESSGVGATVMKTTSSGAMFMNRRAPEPELCHIYDSSTDLFKSFVTESSFSVVISPTLIIFFLLVRNILSPVLFFRKNLPRQPLHVSMKRFFIMK